MTMLMIMIMQMDSSQGVATDDDDGTCSLFRCKQQQPPGSLVRTIQLEVVKSKMGAESERRKVGEGRNVVVKQKATNCFIQYI